jgi:hypothetical protein
LKKVLRWRKLTPIASPFLLFISAVNMNVQGVCREFVLLLRMKEYYSFMN